MANIHVCHLFFLPRPQSPRTGRRTVLLSETLDGYRLDIRLFYISPLLSHFLAPHKNFFTRQPQAFVFSVLMPAVFHKKTGRFLPGLLPAARPGLHFVLFVFMPR